MDKVKLILFVVVATVLSCSLFNEVQQVLNCKDNLLKLTLTANFDLLDLQAEKGFKLKIV